LLSRAELEIRHVMERLGQSAREWTGLAKRHGIAVGLISIFVADAQ
jgi:hypothetical protein